MRHQKKKALALKMMDSAWQVLSLKHPTTPVPLSGMIRFSFNSIPAIDLETVEMRGPTNTPGEFVCWCRMEKSGPWYNRTYSSHFVELTFYERREIFKADGPIDFEKDGSPGRMIINTTQMRNKNE